MVRFRRGMVLVLCIVGLAAAPPVAFGDGGDCSWPVADAPHANELLQDDAGSGGDAGDLAGVALDLRQEGVANGSLDHPAGPSEYLDLSDWFTLRLAGAGETLMVNISVTYAADVVPPFGNVRVDLYPPGVDHPVASAESSRGDTAEVIGNALAGQWRFHVQYVDVPPTGSCQSSAPVQAAVGVPSEAREPLGGYHVYVGCHPVCFGANA